MSTKRERVLAKTDGCCGYCGSELASRWHMDHVDALWRGRDDKGGDDSESNLMAACARCNLWKKTLTVDQFRDEISKQHERLLRDSAGYRLAHDFGVISSAELTPKFYFETH